MTPSPGFLVHTLFLAKGFHNQDSSGGSHLRGEAGLQTEGLMGSELPWEEVGTEGKFESSPCVCQWVPIDSLYLMQVSCLLKAVERAEKRYCG